MRISSLQTSLCITTPLPMPHSKHSLVALLILSRFDRLALSTRKQNYFLQKATDDAIANCYDVIALLLCIEVVYKYEALMRRRQVAALNG